MTVLQATQLTITIKYKTVQNFLNNGKAISDPNTDLVVSCRLISK